MRGILAAALCVALAGCTVEDEAWHGAEAFTAIERAGIEHAAGWMTEHAGAPPLAIVWDHRGTDCDRSIMVADLPAGTIGDSSRGCIRIDVSQGADRVGVVFAHEMSHVRGACHHAGEGLMSERVPASLVWTDADRHAITACAPM